MKPKMVSTPAVRSLPKLTRHIVRPGDPVWVKVGLGECAAKVITIHRDYAVVKFLTGAREKAAWDTMRFREVAE
jgi:hypothetical protein